MAIADNFLGISLEFDQSLSQFQGITLELTENLIVTVVDSLGDPVDGATVSFTINGVTETAITQANGTVGYLVEEQSTVTISAEFDCLFSDEVDILHNGIDDFRSVTLTLSELPCLDIKPTNNYNFIRWQKSNNLQFPITEINDCVDCLSSQDSEAVNDRIPNAYAEEFDPNLCRKQHPVIVKDEEYKFILNQELSSSLSNLNPLTTSVCLLDNQNNQILIGTQSVSVITTGTNLVQVYGSFTLSNEVLRNLSLYRLCLYNTENDVIVFISNELKYFASNYGKDTVLLQYRNSSDVNGYEYQSLPADFYNTVRVQLTRIERQPEIELTQYQEESTGAVRNQKTRFKKLLTLQAYFFDDYAHDAMLSLSVHDDIKINGRVMTVKTAYNIETNVRSNVDHGTIELYDQAYSGTNLGGNAP